MKNITIYFPIFFIFCFAFISCQKIELKPSNANTLLLQKDANAVAPLGGFFFPVSAPYIPHDDDSIERLTTLGIKITNPYLIPNMQQAYTNLGLSSSKAIINNLYVRFLPSSTDQLYVLDSTMDAQALELFDTPVDYIVTYEGDYYQDPSIPDEQITWQYAVEPPNFTFPSGIQHETLAQIHIPDDQYTAVETEAERLAHVQDSISYFTMSSNSAIQPNVLQCQTGYTWNFQLMKCMPIVCEEGYHLNGNLCVPDNPPPPLDPPPVSPDAAIPAGNIYVHDTNLPSIAAGGSNVAVRKVRVVARRWFKVKRTFTDNYGHFVFTKRFKHKVRINVKFKNDDAQIRNVRGIWFWQMLFPVKKTLGIFSGDKSSINYTFIQYTDYSAKGNMYWVAATVHNAVQEYREYAPIEHIGLPPQGLKIFLSKNGFIGGGGATPMFAKRLDDQSPLNFGKSFLDADPNKVTGVFLAIKKRLDMIIGYRYEDTSHHRDITELLSDRIKETTYHELTHSAHYAALGSSWYGGFVNAEISEIEQTFLFDKGYLPYGRGNNNNSPIIALGEAWAYYMGHYLADKTYGVNSSQNDEQGIEYINNSPVNGLSSHLNLLEDFSPFRTGDHFHWIPQGLFYDMMDARNETGNPVIDAVSGYTNQQFFNAFSPSITTLGIYRSNLLQQNGNNQSTQITSLFVQYGY